MIDDVATELSPLPFEELYRQYRDPLFRYLVGVLRNEADAEEVAAETFERAFRAYERARPDTPKAWLFRIASNQAISHLRRATRRRRLLGILGRAHADGANPEDVVQMNTELRLLLDGMGTLSDTQRKIVALRHWAGLSFPDIGEVLGMSDAAARVSCQRAIKRLQDLADAQEVRA